MGIRRVKTPEEVTGEGEYYVPEWEPVQRVRIAACSHTGRKLSIVRMTCTKETVKVCPACGEVVR